MKIGHIYVIASGPHSKIGKTVDPRRPWQLMVRQSPLLPFEVSIVGVWDCHFAAMDQLEKRLHEKFAAKRIRGEWFALSERDWLWFMLKADEEFPMWIPDESAIPSPS